MAPLKAISVPRLELIGAVIGLKLTIPIAKQLEFDVNEVSYWCDSMIVLGWIRNQSRKFKPFVANRIGELQSHSNPQQWRYVPSEQNAADLITRGTTVSGLKKSELWWNGPKFLQKNQDDWPSMQLDNVEYERQEERKTKSGTPLKGVKTSFQKLDNTLITVKIVEPATWRLDPKRFSSCLRLKRIRAWVNRFIDNCAQPRQKRTNGELTVEEIDDSENQLIQLVQLDAFSDEMNALQNGKELPKTSKLLPLKPWLDEDGILRLGGRLQFAEFLPFSTRHPIVPPRKEWITTLIVKSYHEAGNHVCGTNHTLASLSSRYWILCGREEIGDWEKKCAECKKRTSKLATQLMAPLPDIRLRMTMRAFAQTAVDFASPFVTIQGRGKRREKRYLSLFTCLATRAVHLEIAYSMETDSFLNSFYRMASRRGLPDEVISDNGRNFIGADKELKELVKQLDVRKLQVSTANLAVKWHFNPPYAPHFGGIHETMIKAAKRVVYTILSNADITDEELLTAFVGAEGLINSRPLTYQSANPKDEVPLTPNHFLIGQMGGKVAPESVDITSFNPQKRWRRVQELIRHFWHR